MCIYIYIYISTRSSVGVACCSLESSDAGTPAIASLEGGGSLGCGMMELMVGSSPAARFTHVIALIITLLLY